MGIPPSLVFTVLCKTIPTEMRDRVRNFYFDGQWSYFKITIFFTKEIVKTFSPVAVNSSLLSHKFSLSILNQFPP